MTFLNSNTISFFVRVRTLRVRVSILFTLRARSEYSAVQKFYLLVRVRFCYENLLCACEMADDLDVYRKKRGIT